MNVLYKIFKIEPNSLTGKLIYKGVMLAVTAIVLFASISMAWFLKVTSNSLDGRGVRVHASNISVTYEIKTSPETEFENALTIDGKIDVFGIIPGGNIRILKITIQSEDAAMEQDPEYFEKYSVKYSLYISGAQGYLYDPINGSDENGWFIEDTENVVYSFIMLKVISSPENEGGISHNINDYSDVQSISLGYVLNQSGDDYGKIVEIDVSSIKEEIYIIIYADELNEQEKIDLLQNAQMEIPEMTVKVTRIQLTQGGG